MKKAVILFVLLVLAVTLSATIQNEVEATAKRLLAELCQNNRSIPYVHRNYFPMTYALTMNTRDFGCTNMLVEIWDGTEWQDAMQWDFYYDGEGRVSGYDQYFYGPGYTVAYFYYEILYDAQDRVTELWMDVDFGTGTVAGSHEIYTYGNDWLDHYFLEGDYGAGSYMNQEQADYTYTSGELTLAEYQEWEEDLTAWVNQQKYTFTYDNGLLDTVLDQWWDTDNSSWINEYFETFTMLSNTRPSVEIVQMWNGSAFENSERFSYTYPRYEHTERLEEDWINGGWINAGLEQVTYNNDDLPQQVDRFIWDGSTWQDDERYIYTYGPSGTNPNLVEPISCIRNYPNPFNPQTTIEFSVTQTSPFGKLEIFNLKGQVIHTQEFSSGNHSYVWNATDQASGIYFYKISSGDFSETKKMILMK
ncbi:MAG: T9SS type A sorting domain-containing protein [Candidatus Cloacimonetes bacterium]|nr:T9SS type A sorting domain-containing protein [Candidatus Cloacimonadota bacterium]MCF7813318.1 T9SS type A sorting domain-containing protein [Candidatus Cloacimonadota bacterium]MCF7867393.1 T9SS type A sorting domain-containing protein [Candidatus Cloacimonadota bacterium]MCF7882827.1 T9SS type A sorting domain-containing protein [Candidatus Cloacimonadota bacterium]